MVQSSSIDTQNKELRNFTFQEIEEYLIKFKALIEEGKFQISLNENRQENIDFIEDYNLNSIKQKEILLSIEANDFCYALNNLNPKFAHEILYVFCPQRELNYFGDLENVDIYIKSNLLESDGRNDYLIMVSFHKRNKPITYLFR
ncbi:hypothetical protein [Gottfriedia acidiceleris]|uniref:hypothetical protein n=1 Tax=Gottfriedia acidiceleris TaxID=371036 RepID=UPI003D1AD813